MALLHKNEIQVRVLNETQAREFVNASFARLEIPLLDSEKPVIDLMPKDEDLRKLIRRCLPAAFSEGATVVTDR